VKNEIMTIVRFIRSSEESTFMDMSTDNLDIMEFFVSMLIVGIGVALLATGIFTSYFGAGKSQKIGFALLFLGAITLALVIDMAFGTIGIMPEQFERTTFEDALISGVSALSGMIIGMFMILFVLMKVDTVDDLEDLDLEDLEDLDLDEELKKLEEELNQADNNEEDNSEEDK
jgi:amino acid transporter